MRLIDADALERHVYTEWANGELSNSEWVDFRQWLKDEPTVEPDSPWRMVEEPPKDGQECVVAFLGPTDWIYEHATYHSDLNPALEEDIFIEGTDGFIVDGNVGYARHGLFKYWMPIEPPKEDA